MLILKRKKDAGVTLLDRETGREIGHVVVAGIENDYAVFLGFDCPGSVTVLRDELLVREGAA